MRGAMAGTKSVPHRWLRTIRKGFFRLSAFGHRENVIEAVERIKRNLK